MIIIAIIATLFVVASTWVTGNLQQAGGASEKRLAAIFFCGVTCLVAIWGGYAAWYNEPHRVADRARRADPCNDVGRAYDVAKAYVKKRLVAPATAEFPAYYSSDVQALPLAECRFSVQAYVDAQNGFGAMLRNPYSLTLQYYKEDDTWSLLEFSM
tara:strand:- start:1018 stop:1485 length:468 start_codon:yes stop_codon:yes gene_type:complete